MVAGGKNLLQAVPDLFLVIDMAGCNRCKPYNRIHRRTDIVGHIGKEGGLRPVGMLRLHQRILQSLCLLPLFPHTFRNFLYHYHDHNIVGIVIPCHNKSLADAHLPFMGVFPPIFHRHLRVALLKMFLQMFYIYLGVIFLHRLFQHILPAPLHPFGSLAGRL